jgi:D-sedoheptulose 7-phosphate isomerase
MDLIARVAKHFEDSAHTKLNAVDAMSAPIAAAIETMFNCLINGGKILACGNGGSAGDAQHFAAELIGRFEAERQELAAIALTTDSSILTAVGNDYSFSQIFPARCAASATPATCCSPSPPPAIPATSSKPSRRRTSTTCASWR